jgi:hypothetical protein
MATAFTEETHGARDPETEQDMAKYGITRVAVDYFYLGDIRYTNLRNAVAQAKRQRRRLI